MNKEQRQRLPSESSSGWPMTFEFTESEFLASSDDHEGRCTKCGAEAYGVEPDARKYTCEECGEAAVYGLEELLMMGLVEIA